MAEVVVESQAKHVKVVGVVVVVVRIEDEGDEEDVTGTTRELLRSKQPVG